MSRMSSWNTSTKSTKDESCSEKKVVDDSGGYAVFTEQDRQPRK